MQKVSSWIRPNKDCHSFENPIFISSFRCSATKKKSFFSPKFLGKRQNYHHRRRCRRHLLLWLRCFGRRKPIAIVAIITSWAASAATDDQSYSNLHSVRILNPQETSQRTTKKGLSPLASPKIGRTQTLSVCRSDVSIKWSFSVRRQTKRFGKILEQSPSASKPTTSSCLWPSVVLWRLYYFTCEKKSHESHEHLDHDNKKTTIICCVKLSSHGSLKIAWIRHRKTLEKE